MPARDLYNKLLIDHYKSGMHRGVPDSFTHSGTGHNHNCGDEITVYLTVSGEMIENASFEGKGCMICQASASMMASEVKGKSVERALRSVSHLNKLLKWDAEAEAEAKVEFEVEVEVKKGNEDGKWDGDGVRKGDPDYVALTVIREFPMRIRCATLAWDTAARLLKSV
jgi:nitrogen fixation protein NifU and related proteins